MYGTRFVLSSALFLVSATHLYAGTLEEVARLTPSDAGDGLGQAFGASVAIDRDWIVVGAPGDDQFATDSGAAYVFRRDGTTWVEHFKLWGLPLIGDNMGHSVAIDGDRIVVGAPNLLEDLDIALCAVGIFAQQPDWIEFHEQTCRIVDDPLAPPDIPCGGPCEATTSGNGDDICACGCEKDIAVGDLDGDEDVDSNDYETLHSLFTGPWSVEFVQDVGFHFREA